VSFTFYLKAFREKGVGGLEKNLGRYILVIWTLNPFKQKSQQEGLSLLNVTVSLSEKMLVV